MKSPLGSTVIADILDCQATGARRRIAYRLLFQARAGDPGYRRLGGDA